MWLQVTIVCEPGFEDAVSACIFESGFSGLEEHEEFGKSIFKAFFIESPDGQQSPLDALKQSLYGLSQHCLCIPASIIAEAVVPDQDWETSWRHGLGAVEVGERFVVRPSWIPYENTLGRIEIIIDPKMAFGTGGHPTTVLCLELLETPDLDGISVIDAGCGSGILSIAAVKLGARHVLGFDNDPFSVENARENVLINSVHDRVSIIKADLTSLEAEPCGLALANIMSSVLIPNLTIFHALVKSGGKAVFSGLLAEEEGLFTVALSAKGFEPSAVCRRGEWIALTVSRCNRA